MSQPVPHLAAGIACAVFATLSWALNFIAPYVSGAYSLFDLLALRFLLAGLIGGVLLLVHHRQLTFIRPWQRGLGLSLGVMGYLGYSACIAGGILFAGPVLTPALIGLVPVLLALLGNVRCPTLTWSRLVLPLGFLLCGLLLIHLGSLDQPLIAGPSLGIGLLFSVLAVVIWLVFSLLNQHAMDQLPTTANGAWTGLMMAGGALGTLCLLPIGLHLDLLRLPHLGFGFDQAGSLYAWALALALLSSVAGGWAWNLATRYLPMVLSAQLISLESLFASVLGLLFHGRWPTPFEALGLGAVLLGAMLAVRVILPGRGQEVGEGKACVSGRLD